MKRKTRLSSVVAMTSLLALPIMSHATCTATGEIPRFSVQTGVGLFESLLVRSSAPGSIATLYFTEDTHAVAAALTAQANHQRVTVVGDAATCGAAAGGIRSGGFVSEIHIAP